MSTHDGQEIDSPTPSGLRWLELPWVTHAVTKLNCSKGKGAELAKGKTGGV
jgi:hypothetical protein